MKNKNNKFPAVLNIFGYNCLVVALLFLLTAGSFKRSDDKNYDTKLQIINNKNGKRHNFLVKIANNIEEKERGLMFVTDLPDNYGMVFEFDPEQIVQMWMKNTKISLDMIFIDRNNRIAHIHHNAHPESTDIISSEEKIIKVLEINGGRSKYLDINVGDYVKIIE